MKVARRKVQSGGAGAALSVILVWVAGLLGVEVPAEVASAFTTLIAAAVYWAVPSERASA